jgi:hypothetical protein
MPRCPEGKVGVYFYLSKKLVGEFRNLAFQKHGNLHGSLSYEAEAALGNWLIQNTQNHTKQLIINKVNPAPKVFRVFTQIKSYLKEKYGYAALISGQQVPRQHLVEAISMVRGVDDRTIRSWLRRFASAKVIKWIAGEIFEVL